MSNLLDQMRADTDTFLEEWGEALVRQRVSVTYDDARRGTETWGSDLAFTGDFQALSGDEMRAEAGLQQKSQAKIIATYDVDVLAGDRVVRGGLTFRCNYVNLYEDHATIYVYREVNP